jgi:hypothetical protein
LSSSLLRSRSAIAGLALTTASLGGLWLSAQPAQADVIGSVPPPVNGSGIVFDDDPTGAACTMNPTPGTSTGPVVADGLPHTVSASGQATDTEPVGGGVTTIAMSSSRTITATPVNGQLGHVSIQDSWSGSLTAPAGQTCNAAASATNEAEFGFDLVRPAYVTITGVARGMTGEAIVTSLDGTGGGGPFGGVGGQGLVAAVVGGAHGTTVGSGLLPAGTMRVAILLSGAGLSPQTSARSGTASLEISLQDPGQATAAQTGKGSKYLALSSAQSCTNHTVTATWSKKAGKKKHSKVKKAVFTVDSAKAGTAKKPTKGKVTTVKGIPLESSSVVTATITLTNGKTVTTSRPYLACS